MVVILAAALLVPATSATIRAWSAWHEQNQLQVDALVDAARIIAAYQDEQIEATFELIAEHATHSVIRTMQMPACAELLHVAVRQSRVSRARARLKTMLLEGELPVERGRVPAHRAEVRLPEPARAARPVLGRITAAEAPERGAHRLQ